MVIQIRPTKGGFLRAFGCGWFIREFLLGHGPEGSIKIDPDKGACQEDVFYHYKLALHKAYAQDVVAWENDERMRAGKNLYTEAEYAERVDWHLRRIPYKLVKARYHSFRRYFHYLKQLKWVELTGVEEVSTMQEVTDNHPTSHPRKLYGLTGEGIRAPDEDWSNPQRLIYSMIAEVPAKDYLKEKRKEKKYRRTRRGERFLRPFTAGMFIREYLTGLGPEDSPKIDPEVGDYAERIFYHYKEALRRAYARDAVALENDKRIRDGLEPYTPAEYAERLNWHVERIPYKLTRCRFHSFVVYFSNLQRLGWVELTGKEEESQFQDHYPPGPPRRYFRLTKTGRQAADAAWSNPLFALYGERWDREHLRQLRKKHKYTTGGKRGRPVKAKRS